MTEQATISKRHYGAIDGLRVFSAIGIVLMHVLANGKYAVSGFVFDSIIPSFTNLVFLFMVISGFAMCCGYYDRMISSKRLGSSIASDIKKSGHSSHSFAYWIWYCPPAYNHCMKYLPT